MTDTTLVPPEDGMVCDQVGGAVVWYWPVAPGFVIAEPRHITVGAFKDRLLPEERKAIRLLARTDLDVEDYMDLLNSASFVDLDDQRTREGLQHMEVAGVLAAGRALAVLDAVVLPGERP